MPWWIWLALSALWAQTANKRHALPYMPPSERELLRQFDAMRRQGVQLQRAQAAQRYLMTLKAEIDTRKAKYERKLVATQELIQKLRATPGATVPPDLVTDIRWLETELRDISELVERFTHYTAIYEKLVGQLEQNILGSELCGYV